MVLFEEESVTLNILNDLKQNSEFSNLDDNSIWKTLWLGAKYRVINPVLYEKFTRLGSLSSSSELGGWFRKMIYSLAQSILRFTEISCEKAVRVLSVVSRSLVPKSVETSIQAEKVPG